MKGKTNVCVCTNLLAPLSTMQFCHHRAAPPHPRIYRVPPLGGGGANSTKSFSTVSLSSSYLKSYLRYILSHFIKTKFIFFWQYTFSKAVHLLLGKRRLWAEGVLPYISYTGLCRSTGSWFWSSLFRTGYPFQRRFLERGITFRTHESSSFVSSDLKLFKDRLLLRIRFNALTSKLLHSCCTLERSIKNLPISWTGYQC